MGGTGVGVGVGGTGVGVGVGGTGVGVGGGGVGVDVGGIGVLVGVEVTSGDVAHSGAMFAKLATNTKTNVVTTLPITK